jgi:hypothetical protein
MGAQNPAAVIPTRLLDETALESVALLLAIKAGFSPDDEIPEPTIRRALTYFTADCAFL